MLKVLTPIDAKELEDATCAIQAFGFRLSDFDFRGWQAKGLKDIGPSNYVEVSMDDTYERLYRVDSPRSWVIQFEDDLINGLFGVPLGRRNTGNDRDA